MVLCLVTQLKRQCCYCLKEVVAAGWQVNTVQTALFAMLESEKEVWCKEKLREVLGTFNRMMG